MFTIMSTVQVDSYWVLPDQFLAGEYPGGWDEEESRARIHWLLDRGVTAFFDLTEADEGMRTYANLLVEEAARRGINVQYTRFPIRDHTAPSEELALKIVETLEHAMAEGRVPYLHCFAGIGRTGTIVGIWMVRNRRISGAEAMETIAGLRRSVRYAGIESPEMQEQVALLRNWPHAD